MALSILLLLPLIYYGNLYRIIIFFFLLFSTRVRVSKADGRTYNHVCSKKRAGCYKLVWVEFEDFLVKKRDRGREEI